MKNDSIDLIFEGLLSLVEENGFRVEKGSISLSDPFYTYHLTFDEEGDYMCSVTENVS